MIPAMMAAGAGMAGIGLAGSYLSGGMSRGRGPERAAYDYNYDPQYNWGKSDEALGYQQQTQGQFGDLYRQSMLEAQGKAGPSQAEMQMRTGMQANALQATQQAANARGGPAATAAAQRQAQATAAATGANIAQAAGMQRAQERQAALGVAMNATQGGASNAASMRGMSQAEEQARIAAEMQAARYAQEGSMAYDQAATGADQAYRARQRQLWGSLMQSGGAMGSMGTMQGMGGGGGG